uniref:Uncharacterized protein n=1 Tax=Anopheles epiroticus TaxID=199890 RepID=A0A182PKR4_9DIPT
MPLLTDIFIRILALFVAGKVQSLPVGAESVPAQELNGPTETNAEDVATTITGDDITVTDTTTQSIRTSTHDRVLFTDTPVMDAITIVWYLATFIALISFFLVMACADHNRCRSRKPSSDELTPPPTPAPSYRQFAPPSYDSLVFEKDNDSIFIIPYDTRMESDHVRSADELASNLEYIIEAPPTTTTTTIVRQMSSLSVRISDISEGRSEDVPTVVTLPNPTPAVQQNDATERYVTVL